MSPKDQILRVIQKGKISGSWLISGPFGVGKKAFVSSLAHYLTSGNWAEDYAYNSQIKWIECGLTEEAKKEIQKMILAGKEVEENAKTVARKKEITVDDIREGIQFLSLKPGAGEFRILIVSLAEDMNVNAANALLKVLEEPYERSVIILISENTGKLLPTIRSRCRKIIFPLETFENTVAYIQKTYPNCKAPELMAELSNGSFGMADMIYQQNGIELYQKINAFLLPIQQVNIEQLNKFAEDVSKDESIYELFLSFLNHILRDKIRRFAISGHPKGEFLTDLYFDIQALFGKTNSLYLDKKQIIINTLLRIGGELN